MQGESVSFKGNQAAYLMPGDSIEGVWHNPMTRAEYDALQAREHTAPAADGLAVGEADGATPDEENECPCGVTENGEVNTHE
jgi:hypothetical protein